MGNKVRRGEEKFARLIEEEEAAAVAAVGAEVAVASVVRVRSVESKVHHLQASAGNRECILRDEAS